MEITQGRFENNKRWGNAWRTNIGFRLFFNPDYFNKLYDAQRSGQQFRDKNLDIRTQTLDNDIMNSFFKQTKDKQDILKDQSLTFFVFHQFLSFQYNDIRELYISLIPKDGREYLKAVLADLPNSVFTKLDIYSKNLCNFFVPLMSKVYFRL